MTTITNPTPEALLRPKVFIPEYIADTGMALLKAHCDCIAPWASGQPVMNVEAPDHPIRQYLYEANAVIVRVFTITEADLAKPNQLKIIVKHGVGLDNIDIPAATAHGIPVAYTPTGNTNAVAEHTMALMLSLIRHIEPAGKALLAGRFHERNDFQGDELQGKTLGLIGLGRIGSLVAKKAAHGFDMRVIAYDPYVHADAYDGPAQLVSTLEALLSVSDFISLHVGLTDETRQMINGQALSLVKPTCRIINTSRGAAIDQAALIEVLKSDRLGGAALDVFEDEPLPANHPITQLPHVVLTPHIAGVTTIALERIARESALAVLDALAGRTPEYVVNGLMVDTI